MLVYDENDNMRKSLPDCAKAIRQVVFEDVWIVDEKNPRKRAD